MFINRELEEEEELEPILEIPAKTKGPTKKDVTVEELKRELEVIKTKLEVLENE